MRCSLWHLSFSPRGPSSSSEGLLLALSLDRTEPLSCPVVLLLRQLCALLGWTRQQWRTGWPWFHCVVGHTATACMRQRACRSWLLGGSWLGAALYPFSSGPARYIGFKVCCTSNTSANYEGLVMFSSWREFYIAYSYCIEFLTMKLNEATETKLGSPQKKNVVM